MPGGILSGSQDDTNYERQKKLGYIRLGYVFLFGHLVTGFLQQLGRILNHKGKYLDLMIFIEAMANTGFLILVTICL
jgi:hypothetical protein